LKQKGPHANFFPLPLFLLPLSARKLLSRGIVVWEPAQVTLSCKLLHFTYFLFFLVGHLPTVKFSMNILGTRSITEVVTDTFCRCGCVWPRQQFLARAFIIIIMIIIIIRYYYRELQL